MRQTVIRTEDPPFLWVDVVGPDREELTELALEFGFHLMAVEDCLDPWHLPKHERFGDTTFVILRSYDRKAAPDGASVQELTRKIAIFARPGLVVTIHRVDLGVVSAVRDHFQRLAPGESCNEIGVVGALMNRALDSYEAPLDAADKEVDLLEEALLDARRRDPDLGAIHQLKQRVNVVKRLLWQTMAVTQRLVPPQDRHGAVFQDVRENVESYYFYADQLVEELNNLLSIHVALSSHRTNEVMRVLTVFSAFFLPLTFIVGVYGMNFRFMPELSWRMGYPLVVLTMAVVCGVIAWWFRRRGWLGGNR
ncbi:MAG: CorA family divalent cation transporter [Gemmatimonadales bacterium]